VAAFLEFGITQATVKWIFLHLSDPDTYGNGFASAAVAGLGELAGIRGRADVFGGAATEQWVRGLAGGKISSSAIARNSGGNSGRKFSGGFWEFLVVGPGGQDTERCAGHEGMGMGDVKNDRHDRCVSRFARHISDSAGGEPAREA